MRQLGADAVIGGDQHGIAEARRLQVEQAAEAADLGLGAEPPRRAHQRLDLLDHAVACIDVDAGSGIGQAARFAHPVPSVSPLVGRALRMKIAPPQQNGAFRPPMGSRKARALAALAASGPCEVPGFPSSNGQGTRRPRRDRSRTRSRLADGRARNDDDSQSHHHPALSPGAGRGVRAVDRQDGMGARWLPCRRHLRRHRRLHRPPVQPAHRARRLFGPDGRQDPAGQRLRRAGLSWASCRCGW